MGSGCGAGTLDLFFGYGLTVIRMNESLSFKR